MEMALETDWRACKFGRAGFQGISRAGHTMIAMLMEALGMAPACYLCEGRAHKRNNSLCQHFCQRQSYPQAFADARHFSSSSYAPGGF